MVSFYQLVIVLLGILALVVYHTEGQIMSINGEATNTPATVVELFNRQTQMSNRLAGSVRTTGCPYGKKYSFILKSCIESIAVSGDGVIG
ncbi:unnamed protein product [Orchesella dallaii]|uniref:Uncharacterized protein n=1 Tax=Orchesella dallaii TaxID=48710 RepID=A0ABP1R8N4_9HEXA